MSASEGKADWSTFARLKFSFVPRYSDELEVRFNDIVRVRNWETAVAGWSEAEFRGESGFVPTEFLQPLPTPYEGASALASYAFAHPKDPDSGQFLRFEKGDEVLVIDRPESGWCVGISHSHLGLFLKATWSSPPQ